MPVSAAAVTPVVEIGDLAGLKRSRSADHPIAEFANSTASGSAAVPDRSRPTNSASFIRSCANLAQERIAPRADIFIAII